MQILLVITFLIPFVLLGFIMSKLDKLLVEGVFVDDYEKCRIAIVLGETNHAKQITTLLKNDGIQVFHLTEPFLFKKEQSFYYLFALSESDADNIVLCKICKKIYGIEAMVSICSDWKNEDMFISERIRYFHSEKVSTQVLYNTVLQELEMKS